MKFFLLQFFSGTEHSGIDDLILDVSQASYTNGEYVDAKEWFNIDLINVFGQLSSFSPKVSPISKHTLQDQTIYGVDSTLNKMTVLKESFRIPPTCLEKYKIQDSARDYVKP